MIDTTSLNTLMSTVRTVFPYAELGEDNGGQIILYTGLYQTGDEDCQLSVLNEVLGIEKDIEDD